VKHKEEKMPRINYRLWLGILIIPLVTGTLTFSRPQHEKKESPASTQVSEKEKTWEKIKEMKKENITFPLLISEVNAGGLMGSIENIKGFLPASQLSADHYPKVDEGNKNKILEKLKFLIGKKIQVKILDFDPAANKLIFSEKLVEKDKIKDIINKYKIGDKIQVRITKIVDFGAFVKLEDTEVDGLVHISEISNQQTENIENILKEGETKEAKIINIDDDKISLSFKALEEKSSKEIK